MKTPIDKHGIPHMIQSGYGKILVLNQPYKPLVCSNCNGICGFIPEHTENQLIFCYECYTSSLDDDKYKELTKTKRRDI